MNGQEFHLFRAGLDLVELSGQVLSEVLRVVLARRAYSKCCSPVRRPRLWPRRCVAVPAAQRQAPRRSEAGTAAVATRGSSSQQPVSGSWSPTAACEGLAT